MQDHQNTVFLVTGAAGFIGCNFVRFMLERYPDIKVISLDKLTYAGCRANLAGLEHHPRHRFVQGDVSDGRLVRSLLRDFHIHVIVHFAAESHVDNSIKCPILFFETNVMGTLTLLEAARSVWLDEAGWDASQCRFHHISTDEVYGSLDWHDPPFTELSQYQPNSPYSASKAASDHVVRAYYHTYQLPVTLSNCSNNFGPYQHSEKLIPTVINACLRQKSIPVYGDGSNIRDWLYVDDHCKAIDLILRKANLGEMYNIGGGHELDNLTLIKNICQIMDDYHPAHAPHARLISFVEDRKGHDKRYAIDNRKIQNELGWATEGDFFHHLMTTIEFYLN